MPTLSAPFLALFGYAALLGACFDVQQVDVADDQTKTQGLLIDDFDDGDRLPASASFVHWFCQEGATQCGVSAPGASSPFAYGMSFELQDPANGISDYPGAVLRTWRSGARLDFSHYENLVFSASLAPVAAQEQPTTEVDVLLSCPGQGDAADAISSIASGIEPTTSWQTYKLRLAAFRWRSWQGPMVDASTCLAQIDGLEFHLGQPSLLDGQTTAGTLLIDNVYLQ